jgi:hypothetical protein
MGGRPRAIGKKEVYNQGHLPDGTLLAWKTHVIAAWRDLLPSMREDLCLKRTARLKSETGVFYVFLEPVHCR